MEVIQQEIEFEGGKKELCKNICKWIKNWSPPASCQPYLEVGEIFLDHEIQMAQIVGWKDGNAKYSLHLAVTRLCC